MERQLRTAYLWQRHNFNRDVLYQNFYYFHNYRIIVIIFFLSKYLICERIRRFKLTQLITPIFSYIPTYLFPMYSSFFLTLCYFLLMFVVVKYFDLEHASQNQEQEKYTTPKYMTHSNHMEMVGVQITFHSFSHRHSQIEVISNGWLFFIISISTVMRLEKKDSFIKSVRLHLLSCSSFYQFFILYAGSMHEYENMTSNEMI